MSYDRGDGTLMEPNVHSVGDACEGQHRGRCGCGCWRIVHTGPTWPDANGACTDCPKGCQRYVEWGSLPSHTQIKPPAGTVVRIEGIA